MSRFAESLYAAGLVAASHFCQLLILWCACSLPTVSIPLLSHAPNFRLTRDATWRLPTNEVIQLTELHEYLISQFDPTTDGSQSTDFSEGKFSQSQKRLSAASVHRGFIPYKLLYAQRLLEAGLPKQALNYCVELLFRCFRSNKPRNSLTVSVLERQIESLTSKVLLEDRGFYASYVLHKNSFSNAFQTWKTELLGQSHLD